MLLAIPFPPIAPEVFTISFGGFDFALRWYALAYIAGLLVGWWIMAALMRRPHLWPNETPPMTVPQVENLLTWVIVGVVLGGRLGYVVFYQPDYYLANPSEILMIWQGGMSFHGGFLGVLIAGLIYCWRIRAPVLQVADAMAVATPIGLMLGRTANFINAELWGRPTELPWGVIFPGSAAQDCGPEIVGICARHPSQLYEALLEGLFLAVLLFWLAYRNRSLMQPGVLVGAFLSGYGVSRALVELVRQPDPQFVTETNPMGYVTFLGDIGFTMGQVLSAPMIAIGVGLMLGAYLRRRR